jgi:hypothetical protein
MKGRDFEYLWKNEGEMKSAERVGVMDIRIYKWHRRFAIECRDNRCG